VATFDPMVRKLDLNSIFQALAHDARRDMLVRLSEEDLTVGELAKPLAMSLTAASKHLKVLEATGLVRRSIVGRRHVCRLNAGSLAMASAWLRYYERFWERRRA
jgi:DNA-binding transcriptional ArsR family regulator